MDGDGTADGGDRLGERDILRADLHAVLRITTIAHAAGAHQGFEPRGFQDVARGMLVEQASLAYRVCADE